MRQRHPGEDYKCIHCHFKIEHKWIVTSDVEFLSTLLNEDDEMVGIVLEHDAVCNCCLIEVAFG